MIRNEQIISVIEKHLGQAKAAKTNGAMREQLVAIKALCDVLLMSDVEPSTYTQVLPTQLIQSQVVSSSNKVQSQVVNSSNKVQSQAVSQVSKLHEDDGANGDSIFDF